MSMNVNVICIGKLKEKYWVDAIKEYSKRLDRYCKFNITELKESKLPKNASSTDEETVMEEEGKAILSHIQKGDYIVTLQVEGLQTDSVGFSKKIADLSVCGVSTIDFVIGGSLGLSREVKENTNYGLSFSKMTFPHQMMRVILLEQIYRSFKIINNEKYHK